MLRRVADLARVAFRGIGESSSFPAEKHREMHYLCIYYHPRKLSTLSATFYKGDNFCDFAFAFLYNSLLKRGLL